MKIIRNIHDMQETARHWQREGRKIGFAPTMGALHEGHVSLLRIAKEKSDATVCSVFVNPAQFAPHEDFDAYPRREAEDLSLLESEGVNIAYLPTAGEMYGTQPGFAIRTGEIGQVLEGITRPHFFDGVALVVAKLFHQVLPDIAVFGEKDFQQLHIIRKLVTAFDFPVAIIGAPVVREADGLAKSSRNLRLTPAERKTAPLLYQIMEEVRQKLQQGASPEAARQEGIRLLQAIPDFRVDYLEIRDSDTLGIPGPASRELRLLAAVFLGSIRLIDNIAL